MHKALRITLFLFGSLFVSVQFCSTSQAADRKLVRAVQDFKRVQHDQKVLDKDTATLSPDAQTKLIALANAQGAQDSDGDHLPDVLEHNTNVCGDNTNGDNHPDASAREARGPIIGANDTAFKLRDAYWTYNDQTVFQNGTKADLVAGRCVAAHGSLTAGSQLITTLTIEFITCDTTSR